MEDSIGHTYLGVQMVRFYFKCTNCSAEFTIKRNPQIQTMFFESGTTRNFESWPAEDELVDEEKRIRDAEEMGDAKKTLENRKLDSKRDMDIMATLDDLKSIKENKLENEVETLSKSIVFHKSTDYVRRIHDEEEKLVQSS